MRSKPAYRLSIALAALMVAQSALGLLMPQLYRDEAWIAATWYGNDWVTLVLGAPLLVAGMLLAKRGSVRGYLLMLGMLGYGAYNYAYYMLGAAIGVFFPIHIAGVLLAVAAIIVSLAHTDAAEVAGAFRSNTPVRALGGFYVFVGTGLSIVWLGMWAAHVFGGVPTPIAPEQFKLVAALDVSVMVTALATGGILLWRRNAWGYVLAAMAGVQGSLYLLVLSLNTLISFARGLSEPPGELPIWGSLMIATSIATLILLACVENAHRLDTAPGKAVPTSS